LDGPEPAGKGGEAVEVVAGLVVTMGSLWMSVAPAAVVLVVGIRVPVFLVVLTTSLALSGVALAEMVVDALT
jgi:predicted phage tail protein